MCVFSVRAGSRDQNGKIFTFYESISICRTFKKNNKSISIKGLILWIFKNNTYFLLSIHSNTNFEITRKSPKSNPVNYFVARLDLKILLDNETWDHYLSKNPKSWPPEDMSRFSHLGPHLSPGFIVLNLLAKNQ